MLSDDKQTETPNIKKNWLLKINLKPKTESANNLADAPMFPAGGPKAKETDTGHSDNPETTTQPKGSPGAKQTTINKPTHDTEKDTSVSTTRWRKTPMSHVTEQLLKRCWKWPTTSDGNTYKIETTWVTTNYDRPVRYSLVDW